MRIGLFAILILTSWASAWCASKVATPLRARGSGRPSEAQTAPRGKEGIPRAKARVMHRVAGLFESIPAVKKLSHGGFSMVTEETEPGHFITRAQLETGRPNRFGKRLRVQAWVHHWSSASLRIRNASGAMNEWNPDAPELLRMLLRDPSASPAERKAAALYLLVRKNPGGKNVIEELRALHRADDAIPALRELARDPGKFLKLGESERSLLPELKETLEEWATLPEVRADLFEASAVSEPIAAVFTRELSHYRNELTLTGEFIGRDLDDGKPLNFTDLPGVVPLVEGRGVPTQLLATLIQLKLAGIEPGSLNRLGTNLVSNIQTGLELAKDPELQRLLREGTVGPELDRRVSEALLETQTGRNLETIATQSGHRIVRIRAIGAKISPIGGSTQEQIDQRPELAALQRSLPSEVPLPLYFIVKAELEPLP